VISPLSTAFRHRCPRCGKGDLYRGYLTIRTECPECGLNYAEHDVGDGPAFFTLTVLGFVIVIFAFMMEAYYRAPLWLTFLLSTLLLLLLTPLCLRWFKSYLVAMKYKLHWSEQDKA
jgi:uncharacterized protein (DUF983 family)